jgi:hypothetical protein
LSKYVEVHFNILAPDEVYGMEVYANFLRSGLFWKDLHQHLIDHLSSINSFDTLTFDAVRKEIIQGIRERMDQLQVQ